MFGEEYTENKYVQFHIPDRADYKCLAFHYTTVAETAWLLFAVKNFPNRQETELNFYAERQRDKFSNKINYKLYHF